MRMFILLQLMIFLSGLAAGSFHTLPVVASLLMSLSFLLTAIYNWRKQRKLYESNVFAAILFGFAGDLVLMRLLPGGLIVGMILFAVEHVLLIFCFVRIIRTTGRKVINYLTVCCAAIYYTCFLAVWIFSVYHGAQDTIFTVGSLVYGLLVSTMAVAAMSLYVSNSNYLLTAFGAASFLLSDSIIFISLHQDFTLSEPLIKTTYYIALVGIVHGRKKLRKLGDG